MQKLHKTNQKGFTIIEVLIVLAIAGLILLIVFLAVPALQRNSRNTGIKNDAQNVLGGVGEFRGANNGKNPASVDGTGTITYKLATGGNNTEIRVNGSTLVKTVTSKPDNTMNSGEVHVMIGQKCNDPEGTAVTAANRSVAAFFVIETSGSNKALQCVDS
jgi:prepilin-type N-terminal cleavage/methylation domain-containing protein